MRSFSILSVVLFSCTVMLAAGPVAGSDMAGGGVPPLVPEEIPERAALPATAAEPGIFIFPTWDDLSAGSPSYRELLLSLALSGDDSLLSREYIAGLIYGDRYGSHGKIIRTDIFDNIIIEDLLTGLKITVKKDIFDNIIIEDRHGSRLTIGEDFRGRKYMEDRKGRRITAGENIFGDFEMTDNRGGKITVKQNIFGDYEYSGDNPRVRATLKKDIFDRWTYSDSRGNSVTFTPAIWYQVAPPGLDMRLVMLRLTDMFLNKQ